MGFHVVIAGTLCYIVQTHSVLVIFDQFLLTLEAAEARVGTPISEVETLAWAGVGVRGMMKNQIYLERASARVTGEN